MINGFSTYLNQHQHWLCTGFAISNFHYHIPSRSLAPMYYTIVLSGTGTSFEPDKPEIPDYPLYHKTYVFLTNRVCYRMTKNAPYEYSNRHRYSRTVPNACQLRTKKIRRNVLTNPRKNGHQKYS